MPATIEPEIREAARASYTPQERYARRILSALNLSGRHIYGGTVPAAEKARRRAANKRARASRRANRG